jgi:hypothetical protein
MVTGRQHQYQPDKEYRVNPNGRWAYQDDWQSNEDIAAQDGMAIDDNRRLEEA